MKYYKQCSENNMAFSQQVTLYYTTNDKIDISSSRVLRISEVHYSIEK